MRWSGIKAGECGAVPEVHGTGPCKGNKMRSWPRPGCVAPLGMQIWHQLLNQRREGPWPGRKESILQLVSRN